MSTDVYINYLICNLKWLETRECRTNMTEEERVSKRKEFTELFRHALEMKELSINIINKSTNESKKETKNDNDNLYD